jgi:hypothetical protein
MRTQEEIDRRRDRLRDAICEGDGVINLAKYAGLVNARWWIEDDDLKQERDHHARTGQRS